MTLPPPSAGDPADRADCADCALLQQLAAGDRAALSALYHAYHRRLGRFVGRMTRRADIVDVVINDCFWIVWQKAASFRGEARLSTWIMGIAYRCALKALRQHGEEPMACDEAGPPMAHDPQPDHELRDWVAKGLQLGTAIGAVGQVRLGGGALRVVRAAVDQPGDQCPGVGVGVGATGARGKEFSTHRVPSVPVFASPAWRSASCGSRWRSRVRAWNMRAFTVPSGHCRMAAISSTEWPPP
jgi:hypothetical protein